jgi:hypothetical protein
VRPIVQAGFVPPIATGFDQFLKHKNVEAFTERVAAAMEREAVTDPFETHPSLKDRLEALGAPVTGPVQRESTSAATLVDDPDQLARSLLQHAIGAAQMAELRSIEWSRVGADVHSARWRAIVEGSLPALSTFTVETLPETRAGWMAAARAIPGAPEADSEHQLVAAATLVFGCALTVLLLDEGWTADVQPGCPVILTRAEQRVEPFTAIAALIDGRLPRSQWITGCEMLGIPRRSLASARPLP